MKMRFVVTVSFVFLLLLASGVCAQETPSSDHASVDTAVAAVKPALVRIEVVTPEYYSGREIKYQSFGSGAIITPDGYVVTNHHVAGHARGIVCTLSTKERVPAVLIGGDPLTDIAVIKLVPETPREFPVAVWGDSASVKVGDNVLAMGSPMALSQSVTYGIVSNTEMIIPRWFGPNRKMDQDGEDVGSFVVWIAHDARIYGGNSGGPLVDFNGRIVGINELGIAGLGGAIPSNIARKSVDALIANGEVERAYMGLAIQPRFERGVIDRGALIGSVLKETPADEAGLKPGDYLIKLAGKDINVQFDEEVPLFNRFVAELTIGQPVEAVVLRGGAEVALSLTPCKREKVMPEKHVLKQWGFALSNISFIKAKELKRKDRDGVLILSVRPGGPSGEAKPELTSADVVTSVNGTPVTNVKELKDLTREITKDKTEPTPVLVEFDRKNEKFITVVKVGIRELRDPALEVKKAWLTVNTQVLTQTIAENMGEPDLTGFRITRIYPKSAAEKAGLQVGDIILALDGYELEASAPEDYEELDALVRQYEIGSTAEILLLRGSERKKIEVELIAAPKIAREMKKYRDNNFEITVREIGFHDRAKEKWEDQQTGVLVEAVETGSWASLGMLGVFDLVLEVNGEKVIDTEDFKKKMEEIAAKKPDTVDLKVLRGIYTLYLQLEPKWDNGA